MIAMQQTDPFATLPRWPNAVSAAVRLEAHTETVLNVPSVRGCVKYPSAPSFTNPPMPCNSNRGFKSQPTAVAKSP